MKNLREDPLEPDTDLISVEDILSPAEAISNQIKSDALNDVQNSYFQKPSAGMMDDEQGAYLLEYRPARTNSNGKPIQTVIQTAHYIHSSHHSSHHNLTS